MRKRRVIPCCNPQIETVSSRHDGLRAALFVALVSIGASLAPGIILAQNQSRIPRGVFSLQKAGKPVDPFVLSDPDVDGISIRQPWRELERSKGVYDWSYLDAEVMRAEKAGKTVLLRIPNEGPATPRWVLDEGVQTFDYEDRNNFPPEGTGKVALYWDNTFLSEKKAMIAATGQHFGGNPAIQIVAAVCASSHSSDWNVPHSPIDIERWRAAGYASEKLIDSCKQIIDVTMNSFPEKWISVAVGQNGRLDPDPDYVARALVGYARSRYPGRFIVQKDSLAATSPMPGDPRRKGFRLLWESRPEVAGQMLWFSYGDLACRNNGKQVPCDPEATLRQAVEIGLAYGMKYIEIYEQDVIHLPGVIRYAHDALTK